MIDRSHALPVTRQVQELGISRGSVYYLPRPTSLPDLAIMRRLDELHMDFPFAGSRMLRDLLAAEGVKRGGSVHLHSPARLLSGTAAGFMPLREAAG
jgi:putative transposase